jgi:hypothetical protein
MDLNGVKMIEGNDELREEKCLQEILRILSRYDCDMKPEIVISGHQILSRVAVVVKQRVPNAGVSGN